MRATTIGLAASILVLGANGTQAQLDETKTTCAPLTYILKVMPSAGFAKMKLSASVNDSRAVKVDTSKNYDLQSLDVTSKIKPTGNALNIDWQITGDANKRAVRQTWVALKVGSGTRYTTVAAFRTDYYAGQKTLNFKFDAPPKNSGRCDSKGPAYSLKLGTAVGDGRVTQFTLSVNGHYYAITNNEPSNMMESQTLDLRPYLTPGKNEVRVQWKVLNEQSGNSSYGAQITRTADGKTEVLAKTLVTARQGETGEFKTTIMVP
jgi:hypothetical protein